MGSRTRVNPGRWHAALTKPGGASTARWRGPGERNGREYARNPGLVFNGWPNGRIQVTWYYGLSVNDAERSTLASMPDTC